MKELNQMPSRLTVATWNLSGGRLARSTGLFDYEADEQINYFVSEIQKVNPDVVCLPETHLVKEGNRGKSLTHRLAEKLGFSYVYEAPLHPSHIDREYMLGIGLISQQKCEFRKVALPSPDFPLHFANGRPATPHTRWLLLADFDSFTVATTHNWPMAVFERSYETEPACTYGRQLADVYLKELPLDRPVIFAGDFNFDSPKNVMPELIEELRLKEALPLNQPTRHSGDRPDHILYGPGLSIIETKIVSGASEHLLCYAKFSLE